MDQLVANFVGAYFVAVMNAAPGACVEFSRKAETVFMTARIRAPDEEGGRLLTVRRAVSEAEIFEGRLPPKALGVKYGCADGTRLAEQTKQAESRAEYAKISLKKSQAK